MPGPAREWFCSKCNAPGASIICVQCRDAAWCSVECQKRDWLVHKGSCRERVQTEAEKRGWDAPPLVEKPTAEEVPAEQTWHALPERCCVWRRGEDGAEPQREEVPRGDARWRAVAGDGPRARVRGRVSVVVPTMHERYRFHAQLWLCFYAQTYVDKELIVVDSGEAPSPFFRDKRSPDCKCVFVPESLSVGEKRNLAIREHATGEIVVNFDDDDLYLPAYVETTVKCLRASKAALVHLSGWHVLDVETAFCATFDRSQAWPSEAAVQAQGELCGFSMAYTYAAWRCVAWPPLTSGEDRHFLRGVTAAGLPVATRADTGKNMTVLHLQHGNNMGRSICQRARADTAVVSLMLRRFEEACRRILKLPQAEYDQMGGGLLCQQLHGLKLTPDPPPAARGLLLAAAEDGAESYDAWARSEAGLHPHRKGLLRQQAPVESRDDEAGAS
uniref:MYND-type domain-containing protein n=1 Tax=Alexandrium monilatum TaxID=311494 RepID=A0A7S4RAW0_9DINO